MLRSIAFRPLVLLAALLFVSACRGPIQAYPGDERDRAEVALLRVPYYAKGLFITVESIDGQVVEGKAYARFAILPGRHLLTGRARGFGQYRGGAPYEIAFVAEAGESYALELEQPPFSDRLIIRVLDGAGETLSELEMWP